MDKTQSKSQYKALMAMAAEDRARATRLLFGPTPTDPHVSPPTTRPSTRCRLVRHGSNGLPPALHWRLNKP